MNNLAAVADILVPEDERQRIFELYDDGLYLQAYQRARGVGPLERWRGTEARILAGRMAGNLGSTRLADWHFVHAWRRDRTHAEAMWFFARYLLTVRGPLAAWQFVQNHPLPQDASRTALSHWYSQHAAILGRLRDFDAAEGWLRKADALGEEAWTCLEWAALNVLEDRHADAEKAARRALQLQPWYRPAVQWVAHFLVQQQRDAEAHDLLTQATGVIESGAVFAQLANLQIELKKYDDAVRSLDEVERLSPLADRHMKQWLAARRCDLACFRGDYDKAIDHCKHAVGTDARTKSKFYENLLPRLTNRTGPGKRVEVPLGYVQQHHRTCSPATLVAIAQFWKMPADHLELAAEITYIGTQRHSERRWACEHGWHVKEFTVTWDSAVALIDQGIPFTLTTTEVSSAHLQAVIGYDSLRRTLIIRDPGERHRIEMAFDVMLERYRSTGPRGMAMVPVAQKDRLDTLSLPDESLYELLYQIEHALKEHRRDDAQRGADALGARAPEHLLTVTARRTIAAYDADPPEQLKQTERLLQLFPGDQALELARSHLLSVLGRYQERVEILKRVCAKKESDPACWHQYALELAADARQHPTALYLLRRAARINPMLARTYTALARIRVTQRKFDEALQLFHFAVCLGESDEYSNEWVAQDYFMEARAQGKTDEAMDFLQKRFERLGKYSSQPARTLYFAYVQQGRYDDAFNALERAMELRPDDGELLTYAAEARMYLGDFAAAQDLLDRADGVSKPAARYRALAHLATYQDDAALACAHWEEVLKIEPIAEDAHRAYCLLLDQREGRDASLRHLDAVCKRFPHHFNLNRLMYDWLFQDSASAREKALKKLIDIHPADAWTRREYALNLAEQDRLEEGFEQLDEAEPLEPTAPSLWSTRGFLHKKAKRLSDSQFAHREAIRCGVDFESSIFEMIAQCVNLGERREAVAFIERELATQTSFGGGVFALRDAALTTMPPEELLGSLRRVLKVRPDLWQAWSAVIRQLAYMERSNEALELAQEAVKRFPLFSAAWLDVAEAHRLGKDLDQEIAALERSVDLAPTWDVPRKWLVDAHERAGNPDAAKAVLAAAIKRGPMIGMTYLDLAELHWRLNEHDEAIKQVKHALKLDPGLENAWNDLCNWTAQLDRYDEAFDVAKTWTSNRRGEARSWLRLGQAYQWQTPLSADEDEKKRIDRCVAAYDEAIKRNPTAVNFYDMKAQTLALAERCEEARKACKPPFFGSKPPLELRGRSAWVTATEGDHDAAKKQMLPVLKEDPTYSWGWNELVNWCAATGEYKAYHDAANDMLKQQPQSALALTYRAEAEVRMDDRTAGLNDLKAAYRKDPCNSLAGFLLFDEQMADEDLAGAEATLATIEQSMAGDFVKARQIQFNAKRGNKEVCLEKFGQLVTSRNTQTWPLDVSLRALDLAGWKEPAEQMLREEMKKPQWNVHLAYLYATSWNPNQANDLPDRIAVIDLALEKLPGNFRFLDLKAELLTSGNQFERAWQTCKEKTYPIDQYALDGRAAWVMYRSGRRTEAIFTMRDLVKQHPKYYWGWMQLADWYGQQQQWVDVLTVAEQMVVINPRDPVGFGYRGQAKENLNDVQAARADYIHALDLQPAYMWGAWQLFNVYVKSGEWQRAEKILDKAKKHADPGDWAIRRVDLLIYQNKKGPFAAEFENLCRKSAKTPWLIDQSLMFIVQAGWWSEAEAVLHRCLDLGPHICDPWVRLRVAMGDRNVGDDVQNMARSRPERTNCIAAYAIELAYAKDAGGLRRWVLTHEDVLRDDTPCWAKVGAALAVVQDWPGIIEWMSDWTSHSKALPGMLLPLVRAHRALGEIDDARKVSLHSLTKLNPDYAASFHKVWLMFDAALKGDNLQVQRYLDSADMGGFDGYHQMIGAMVRALWLTATDPQTGFAQARQLLADTAKYAPATVHDPALTKAYQQCVAEMASLRGTFGAKLWRWWRWFVPTLPVVQKAG